MSRLALTNKKKEERKKKLGLCWCVEIDDKEKEIDYLQIYEWEDLLINIIIWFWNFDNIERMKEKTQWVKGLNVFWREVHKGFEFIEIL